MVDKLFHYGSKNGKFGTIKISKRGKEITAKIPEKAEEIVDISTAIMAIILTGKNLMRVSGYKCTTHNKTHKFTFHSEISFSFPRMYGFDTEGDVISFAKELLDKRIR